MAAIEPQSWIGSKLGASPYRLVKQLGAGKLAETFLAEEMHKGEKVVVKIPHASLFESHEQFRERFHQEMLALKKLDHPHLLRLIDQSEYQGRPFLVFPYCGAGNLKLRMSTGPNGQLTAKPPENLASWLPGVAQALDHLHEQGLVHRDVKPANILFDEEGKAVVADISLTRAVFNPIKGSMTRLDAHSFGTPRYMAPELLGRQVVDGRSDQFSLAMIVWEWLSGRSLFKAESAAEVMAIHNVVLSFLPPWVPGPWKAVLKKGLSRKADERFATCADFAREMLVRVDEGGGAIDDQANFDLDCPEPAPPPPRTTIVQTKLERAPTQVDMPDTVFRPKPVELNDVGSIPVRIDGAAGAGGDLQRIFAAAEKVHDEFSAWFLVSNTTNFPIPFETRGKKWTGAWSQWVKHTIQPSQTQPIFCQGTIAVELRYNFRLSGGLEDDSATICGQLWPAAARPTKEQIDSRYRFIIQDNRIFLDFVHAPLAK